MGGSTHHYLARYTLAMDTSSATDVESSFHQGVLETCASDQEQNGELSGDTCHGHLRYQKTLRKHQCLTSPEKVWAAFPVVELGME